MSSTNDLFEQLENEAENTPSEMDLLKERARKLGVQFSNNIGIDTLKARIQDKLQGSQEKQETSSENQKKKNKSFRQKMYEEQMRLVRLRITNLNPNKKDLPGEVFTVANETLGTVRKYIPYGEVTDNGYHVPWIIYQQLKDREFLNIRVRKTSQGKEVVETTMAKEFALEVLPNLTKTELQKLAAAQAARGDV